MYKKIELLKAWKKDLFAQYSISEIMRLTNKKTKTWVFNTLKILCENRLIYSMRKGNINIYSLNFNNPLLFNTLQFIENQDLFRFTHLTIISECVNKTPVKNYCLIVFGSYAENNAKKNSDLDICFLIGDSNAEKKIKPYVRDVELNSTVKIDAHYITFDDFIKMLLREEENLGKQIFRKHKIFFNADIYYSVIKEAHKNGFRP